MKKLGLIGGIGPESTIEYYRSIEYGVQKKSGQIEERIDIISKFLENGGTKEEAKRMLEVSEEDIIMAEKRISEIHQTICV